MVLGAMKTVATSPATGSDTASPLSPVTVSPTCWVSRMYAAQQHAAPSAQSTPTTRPDRATAR